MSIETKSPTDNPADLILMLRLSLETEAPNGYMANPVDALFAIAAALDGVASAINRLGMNGAATRLGAIENVGLELKNGFEAIARAISHVAEAQQ